MRPGVKILVDHTKEVSKAIRGLAAQRVLVGIPGESSPRKAETDRQGMTNAALGYIHEHGAPEVNLPARPFLVPGVEGSQERWGKGLERAAKQALDGNVSGVAAGFEAAGTVAASAVKQKLRDGPFAPLKPATISKRRRRSKGSKYRRKATSAGDVKPLIDTAQMLNAVTHVVRKEGS